MDKLDFCPNCGNKLDNDDEFCPNCGFNLKKYLSENSDEESEADDSKKDAKKISVDEKISNQSSQNFQSNESAPKPKKNSWKIISIIIVILILVGGYFVGKSYYSKDNQVQRLQDEVISGTNSKMKDALVNEKGEKISNNQISALKRLYMLDNTATKNVTQEINSNQKDSTFSIQKYGNYFLVYPKYKVVMKDKILEISTNINNPTFKIDNKVVATKSVDGVNKIENLTPGVYDLKVFNSKKNSENKSKQISLTIEDNPTALTLNVKKTKKVKKSKTNNKDDKTDINDDESTNNDSEDMKDNDNSSEDDSLFGRYTGDPDLALYSDGTYDLGDKTGTYDILENNDGHVKIRYNQDGGGSIVESYDYSDGELHSSKYDQSWYKD